MFKKLRVF